MTEKRLRVGVLFGGRSGEHEVSILSARGVMGALDREKYEVVPIAITKGGTWLAGGDPMKSLLAGPEAGGSVPVALVADPQDPHLLVLGEGEVGGRKRLEVDVVFPVLHGPFGEDGTVQGLLELAGVPYVGAGVASSAVGMDKALQKTLFAGKGLPVVQHQVIFRWEWRQRPGQVLERVEATLGYPCFVKPANLGSSVGVTKARDRRELRNALDEAARYDRKMLVEQAVDAREIECSVLGNDAPQASVPGEIVPSREFYDYWAKYVDEGSQLLIPAPISPQLTEQVCTLAVEAFVALDCAGMARVDFLLDRQSEKLYISEVNTIPGFTPISMYPKLWEASGVTYRELIDRLIALAVERHADKAQNETSYPQGGEAALASLGEGA
ncbi:MAG: D-alanine--D-alanine ligase [Anaerolineae bacterium]|nr:D-alanine--D-alanine ligase [Anaerolineae bacterium]